MLPDSRSTGIAALFVFAFACETRGAPSERPVVVPPELAPFAGAPAPPMRPAAQSADLSVPPQRLSETGLWSDSGPQLVAAGIEPYQPMYELWSDNAQKRRWVELPAGSQIDTSDLDRWRHPIGMKIWKEFSRDGRALETRYMAKFGPNESDWVFMSYQWNEAGTDAIAVPDGVADAAGTTHDIPSASTCLVCHNGRPSATLGFSAIQLSHDGPGVTLDRLSAAGRFTAPPSVRLRVPGDPIAERALGYLHANCGGCHNAAAASDFGPYADVIFWQSAAQLATVEQTTTYVHLVANRNGDLGRLQSALDRMRARSRRMPPVATEVVDAAGVALVEAWLQQLAARFAPGMASR